MVKVEEIIKETTALTVPSVNPPANDNTVESDISFAADALSVALKSFVPREELKALVQQEVLDFSPVKKIELKVGEEIRVIEGYKHSQFEDVLTLVNLNLPAALIGPAGSGKSTVCEQVANSLELKYYLQNGVTGTHELTGYNDAHGRYVGTTFRSCFEHGGLILVDEVDTSEAGALKWLNTALANGHAAFPDNPEPIKRHPKFRIAIAANTWGTGADRLYVGANQLDASTLDRFVYVNFVYDEKLEKLLGLNISWTDRVQSIRRATEKEKARIVVSPRASIYGGVLLANGWSIKRAEDALIWKGIDPELRARIEKHVPPPWSPAITSFAPLSNSQKKALKAQFKKAA